MFSVVTPSPFTSLCLALIVHPEIQDVLPDNYGAEEKVEIHLHLSKSLKYTVYCVRGYSHYVLRSYNTPDCQHIHCEEEAPSGEDVSAKSGAANANA